MNRFRFALNFIAALTLVSACAAVARAQAQPRVYITANRGSDFNPCNRTSPCRTIQHALSTSVVQQGGHVVILDSGDYQPFIISSSAAPPTVTSVTVEAPPGVVAGITSAGGIGASAVLVLAGKFDKVVLRGLTLYGRTADYGINFASGESLFVENCVVDGFSRAGLNLDRNTTNDTTNVFVTDSMFRNGETNGSGDGIQLFHSGNSAVNASVDNCRFENDYNGINVRDNAHVTVQRSVATGNGIGFLVDSCIPGGAEMNIENSVAANSFHGIQNSSCNGVSGTVRVSNSAILNNSISGLIAGGAAPIYVAFSTISGNVKGLSGTHIISLGNNRLFDNGTDGSFASTIPQQ